MSTAKKGAYDKLKNAIATHLLADSIRCIDQAGNEINILSDEDYSHTLSQIECVPCKFRPYSKQPSSDTTFQTNPSRYTRVFMEHCQSLKKTRNGHWHKAHWRFKDAQGVGIETDHVQPITAMFGSAKNKDKKSSNCNASSALSSIKIRLQRQKHKQKQQKVENDKQITQTDKQSAYPNERICYGSPSTKYYVLRKDNFQISTKYEYMLQHKYDDIKAGNFKLNEWHKEFNELTDLKVNPNSTLETALRDSARSLPPQYTLQTTSNDDEVVFLKSRACVGITTNYDGICNVCKFTAHNNSPVFNCLKSKLARIKSDNKKGVVNYRNQSASQLQNNRTNKKLYPDAQTGKRSGFDEGIDISQMTIDDLKAKIESHLPDLCHKLGNAMIKGDLTASKYPVLMSFLTDIANNIEKKTAKRWSPNVKAFFSIMLRAGGTGLITRFYEEMQGPTKQAVLRWNKSNVSIRFEGVQQDLIESADRYFVTYFDNRTKIPIQIPFDATAILPQSCYHKVMDKMIGGTGISDKIDNNPNVIIEYAENNKDKLCKQLMLIMATPSITTKLIGRVVGVELMSKGCKSIDAQRWIETAAAGFAKIKSNCIPEVISSDGDSGARKYFEDKFAKNDVDGISLKSKFPSFTFQAINISGYFMTVFPDSRHMEKKKRNNGMNALRMLRCGKYVIYASHIEHVQKNFKISMFINDQSCSLLDSDVRVRDKQDWKPVYKLSRPVLRETIKEKHAPYQSPEFTIIFLQQLDEMIQAVHYDDTHPLHRIKLLWQIFEFYKHWSCWLKSKQLSTRIHFVSWQLYHDMRAYAHSLPLIILTRHRDEELWAAPFSPRSYGSDHNEKAFSGVRTAVKGQYHVTAVKCAELLEKEQRLRELTNEPGVNVESNKRDQKTAHGRSFKDMKQHQTNDPKSLKDWFGPVELSNLENQIITCLTEAKQEALKTLESLGVDLKDPLFLEQIEIEEKSNQSNEEDDCECDHNGICSLCDENANKHPKEAFITSEATDSSQTVMDSKRAGIETLAIANSLCDGTMTALDIIDTQYDFTSIPSPIPPSIPNIDPKITSFFTNLGKEKVVNPHVTPTISNTKASNTNCNSSKVTKFGNNGLNTHSQYDAEAYFAQNWPTYKRWIGNEIYLPVGIRHEKQVLAKCAGHAINQAFSTMAGRAIVNDCIMTLLEDSELIDFSGGSQLMFDLLSRRRHSGGYWRGETLSNVLDFFQLGYTFVAHPQQVSRLVRIESIDNGIDNWLQQYLQLANSSLEVNDIRSIIVGVIPDSNTHHYYNLRVLYNDRIWYRIDSQLQFTNVAISNNEAKQILEDTDGLWIIHHTYENDELALEGKIDVAHNKVRNVILGNSSVEEDNNQNENMNHNRSHVLSLNSNSKHLESKTEENENNNDMDIDISTTAPQSQNNNKSKLVQPFPLISSSNINARQAYKVSLPTISQSRCNSQFDKLIKSCNSTNISTSNDHQSNNLKNDIDISSSNNKSNNLSTSINISNANSRTTNNLSTNINSSNLIHISNANNCKSFANSGSLKANVKSDGYCNDKISVAKIGSMSTAASVSVLSKSYSSTAGTVPNKPDKKVKGKSNQIFTDGDCKGIYKTRLAKLASGEQYVQQGRAQRSSAGGLYASYQNPTEKKDDCFERGNFVVYQLDLSVFIGVIQQTSKQFRKLRLVRDYVDAKDPNAWIDVSQVTMLNSKLQIQLGLDTRIKVDNVLYKFDIQPNKNGEYLLTPLSTVYNQIVGLRTKVPTESIPDPMKKSKKKKQKENVKQSKESRQMLANTVTSLQIVENRQKQALANQVHQKKNVSQRKPKRRRSTDNKSDAPPSKRSKTSRKKPIGGQEKGKSNEH